MCKIMDSSRNEKLKRMENSRGKAREGKWKCDRKISYRDWFWVAPAVGRPVGQTLLSFMIDGRNLSRQITHLTCPVNVFPVEVKWRKDFPGSLRWHSFSTAISSDRNVALDFVFTSTWRFISRFSYIQITNNQIKITNYTKNIFFNRILRAPQLRVFVAKNWQHSHVNHRSCTWRGSTILSSKSNAGKKKYRP